MPLRQAPEARSDRIWPHTTDRRTAARSRRTSRVRCCAAEALSACNCACVCCSCRNCSTVEPGCARNRCSMLPLCACAGILLLINARSDCPCFWPSAMSVVALTNALAIVDANQRHHRRPVGSRVRVALRYRCCPGGHTARFAGSLAQPRWRLGATAAFCVLSLRMHAWLAFEVPIWCWISRGTFAPDRAERAEGRAASDTGPPARWPPDSGSSADTHRGGHS